MMTTEGWGGIHRSPLLELYVSVGVCRNVWATFVEVQRLSVCVQFAVANRKGIHNGGFLLQ
jgi:hypothetical protein